MSRTVSLRVLCLFAGVALSVLGSQPLGAQQQPIKTNGPSENRADRDEGQ